MSEEAHSNSLLRLRQSPSIRPRSMPAPDRPRCPGARLLVCILGAVLAALLPDARADVGPPVKIGVVSPVNAATAGQMHAGMIEIQIGGAGRIDGLSLEGEGWRVVSFEPPLKRPLKAGDVLRVPFRAVPADASKPLRVRLTFNGGTIGKTLDFSPQYFARAGKPRPARSVEGARTSSPQGPIIAADWPHAIHFQGRLAYTRAGRDLDGDGVNDIPAQTVGVDGIWFQIMDLDDDIYDEEMYSGHTDQDGYFDVTLNWDDCDIVGCDDPDIYIRWECDTGIVNVQSAGVIEEDYSWSTKATGLISDFTGNEVDFGTLMPSDSDQYPALHIFNSITRAHRFVETRTGLDVPEVDAQWPEDGVTSYYVSFFEEIHIIGGQQWQESTHTHEYGHHFLEMFTSTIAPDYCNGFCDQPECSHCMWCPETGHDAWNEGFPNWLADVFTRSHQADYGYPTLWTRSHERTRICDQDNDGNPDPNSYDPFATEGYIGALLRDIEDDMEDQDNDGVPDVQPGCARDALSLGVGEIFTVTTLDQPQRPSEFISAFRARYPHYDNLLWQTASNVALEYAWADVAQPGSVVTVVSTTHPIGVGGNSPFIHVEWDLPSDDASGISGYSVEWSASPETLPDETEDVAGTETGVTSRPLGLGEWYFSIRTHDCVGNWDDDAAVFGPFEVTECNGNGIVDLCDTACHFADNWCNVPGCGGEPDCNINGSPDACDVARRTSRDCNLNNVPDECEAHSFITWDMDGDGFWDVADNWSGNRLPEPDDYVCIDVPSFATITHSFGNTPINGLRCEESLALSGGSLVLAEDSLVRGSLTISGATLGGAGDLIAYDQVTLTGATLNGSGTFWPLDNMLINNAGVVLADSRVVEASWTTFQGDYPWLRMVGTTLFRNTGVFQATGGGMIEKFSGTPRFDNPGRFDKAGPDTLDVTAPFDNTGQVNVVGGKLVLRGGSTLVNTGSYFGGADGTIEFGHGNCTLGNTSSVDAAHVVLGRTANLTVDGRYNVSETTTLNAGTVTFTPAGNLVSLGQTLSVISNEVTANFNNDEPINLPSYAQLNGWVYFNTGSDVQIASLSQAGGQLTGADSVVVSGPLVWSGGSIRDNSHVHANGGMTINGPAQLLDARILHNPQVATFTGASANLAMSGTSEFDNTGTFNAESDGGISQYSYGHFENRGIFNKLGPGRMLISVDFNNSGTVDIAAGTLALAGRGTHTGSFTGAPAAVLEFTGFAHTLSAASSVSIGHVLLTWGGIAAVGGSYEVSGSTTMSGNTLSFSPESTLVSLGQTLTVSGGNANFNNDEPISVSTFNLDGGTASFNTGQPVNVGAFNQTGGFLSGTNTLAVSGPGVWSGGTMQGGGRTHTDGGLSITGYVVLRDWSGSRTLQTSQTTSFSGAARVVMSGTSAIINQGTFDALADGPIEYFSGTPVFTNNGTFNKLGPGTLPFSVACANTGRFDVQAGLLQFSRAFTQTAGATVLNGGNIQSAQPLDIQGGQLAGVGTITANVTSGGTVSPGTSTGILNISGNYTQNAAGELDIAIGGADPAGQFDQLRITGSATLAGRLRLTLVNDYSPAPGTTFTIVTFASRSGELTELVGPAANRFMVTHNANDITLNALPPAPADVDGDGDVDSEDWVRFEACASGPGLAQDGPECAWARLDLDEDVDQSDFAVFQRCFSGTDVAADPRCSD